MPIEELKGIGAKKGELFRKLGVSSIGELICYYPRSYEDWSNTVNISQVQEGEVCCIKATVASPVYENRISGGRILSRVRLEDESGIINATFFNNRYLRNMLLYGGEYLFMGKVTRSAGKAEMLSPEFIASGKAKNIRPVYGCTSGITSRQIESAVTNALKLLPDNIRESIPEKIRIKYDIITYSEAVRQIHFPDSSEKLIRARKRFAFEEMLVFSMGLCSMKNGRQAETAVEIRNDYTAEYEKLLPFSVKIPFESIHRIGRIVAVAHKSAHVFA